MSKDNTISRQTIEAFLPNQIQHHQLNPLRPVKDDIVIHKQKIDDAYRNLLKFALDSTGGNRTDAASLIGVSRKTFYRMMDKYFTEKNTENNK